MVLEILLICNRDVYFINLGFPNFDKRIVDAIFKLVFAVIIAKYKKKTEPNNLANIFGSVNNVVNPFPIEFVAAVTIYFNVFLLYYYFALIIYFDFIIFLCYYYNFLEYL